MSEDFIEQTFADLHYPGSKRKRREAKLVKPVLRPEIDGWDSASQVRHVQGKDIEFFTIGALSKAVGRPIITLRKWMKEGHLPLSPYRLPATVDKHGKKREGRRLYSRPMIEAVIQIFEQAGIHGADRINWAANEKVTDAIAKKWLQIREDELNN